ASGRKALVEFFEEAQRFWGEDLFGPWQVLTAGDFDGCSFGGHRYALLWCSGIYCEEKRLGVGTDGVFDGFCHSGSDRGVEDRRDNVTRIELLVANARGNRFGSGQQHVIGDIVGSCIQQAAEETRTCQQTGRAS